MTLYLAILLPSVKLNLLLALLMVAISTPILCAISRCTRSHLCASEKMKTLNLLCSYNTYESPNGGNSNIDHFLFTQNVCNLVLSSGITHDADDLSDHSMISLCMSSPTGIRCSIDYSNVTIRGLRWRSASDDALFRYRAEVERHLDTFVIPSEAILCIGQRCTVKPTLR